MDKGRKKGHVEVQYNIATSYLDDTWGEEKSDRKAAFWYMCAYQNRNCNKVSAIFKFIVENILQVGSEL